jgi:excisionase family DNA binding protein
MAAYATTRLELARRSSRRQGNAIDLSKFDSVAGSSLLDALIDQLVERVAQRLAAATSPSEAAEENGEDEWFDSRHAAEYLGVHRDTLRKLAAERAIPSEQDGPNCKLYFRRSDLDSWRRTGGRPRHLAKTLRRVA